MPPRAKNSHDPATRTAAMAWLRQDGRAASLLATANRHIQLEQALRAVLPPALQSACHVLRFEDGRLTLGVPAAAHSAKLRQLGPRIAAALDQRGWQVNGIAVRVQASLSQPLGQDVRLARPGKPNELGERGVDAFEELKAALPPSPLADAVERLVSRRRR